MGTPNTENDEEAERADWFVTAAAAVGDLNSPFYEEERQRDVWNEASAIGFQTMLWLGLAGAAVMVWVGGADAMPYALSLLGVVSVASGVAIGYAARQGVDVEKSEQMTLPRMFIALLLIGVTVAGMIHVAPPDGFLNGAAWGAGVGLTIALLCLAWRLIRGRKNKNQKGNNHA